MSLSKAIRTYINNHPAGEAMIAADIVEHNLPHTYTIEEEKKIRQNVYVILNRFLKTCENFKRYDTGIYYRTDEHTQEISKSSLIHRLFIENEKGESCGYFSGDTFAFMEGYREKSPHEKEIVSNYWRRKIDTNVLGIKVSAPPIEITDENMKLLQLLDVLKWKPDITKDPTIRKSIIRYIFNHELDGIELMSLAVQHANKKTVLSIARLTPKYVEARKHPALTFLSID